MRRSSLRRRVPVPSVTTRKTTTRDLQYVGGLDTNTSNDDVEANRWRYAVDTREIEVGKWETRQGNDFLSTPIGEAVNVEQTSTTGASDQSFSSTTYWAKKIVATATGVLTGIEVRIKNPATATGTVGMIVYSDDAGTPGTELMRTTIAASSITSSYAYIRARSITCPDITNGSTYWVVGYVQDSGSGSYQISTTTNATTGLVSIDSGSTWSASSVDYNVKLYTATTGGVKGMIAVERPNGSTYVFMAHGSDLYSINTGTGATTSVDSGLDASATYCRFEFVNDVLYYVTGLQKPRKYDFSTASEVSGAPENASNIRLHKGVIFYTSALDPTKVYYTNFADYDTFTSTDFLYIPAPKTADPVVAKFPLNGLLYISTKRSKYVLYGAENATFRLDSAIGQKGTFSQESVAYDEDNAYLASDDGIYRFNGAEEVNIAKDILADYIALPNKSSIVLTLANNRLYVWYTPVGSGQNSRCFVYNTLYRIWESNDTLGYVSRAFNFTSLLQGSNRCGMIMYGELSTNDYNSMGEPLSWEHRTTYEHFDAPAQYKRASFYRPHFDSVSGSYSVQVGYATEYADTATYSNISLAGNGPRYDDGVLFDSGATYGGTQQVNPMDASPRIPGQWRRLQLRYRHYAAREPINFDGHILVIETQRVR